MNTICKIEGCSTKAHARGYCNKHSEQIKKHGQVVRTAYTPNEIIIKENYAEVILYNRFQKEVARTIIDIEDIEKVKNTKWALSTGYAMHNTHSVETTLLMHRVVIDCPIDKEPDHINGNRLDNRKSNLRICTHKQNIANKCIGSKNTSGVMGVRFHKQWGWQAYISINGKQKHIGWYETKEEATQQRLIASLKQYGEFAPEMRLING